MKRRKEDMKKYIRIVDNFKEEPKLFYKFINGKTKHKRENMRCEKSGYVEKR